MSGLILPVCLQSCFGPHSINAGYVPEDSLLRKVATLIPIIGPFIGFRAHRSLINQANQALNNEDIPRVIRLLEINNQYFACHLIGTALLICLSALSVFSAFHYCFLVGCMLVFSYRLIRGTEELNAMRAASLLAPSA